MLTVPLVFYPTKLLWVDDDELFLQAAMVGFKNNYAIEACHSAVECLNFFQKHPSISVSLPFLRGYKEHEEYDLINHLPVDIDFNTISDLQKKPQRFQDIAVMIVDYNMPGMTGIELCCELRGLPIKKILLTGDANHQQAVTAFNDGIIDCFIRKDDMKLAANLLMHIKKLQAQYFADITKSLLAHLEADYKLPQSDPIFSDFFAKFCHEQRISEYYLIDKNGTFLTVDEMGEKKYFVIHSDRTLDAFTDLYNDDAEVMSFLKATRRRNKIPFFGFRKEPWDFEFTDWNHYFYSPKILEGRQRYYWTQVPIAPALLQQNIA